MSWQAFLQGLSELCFATYDRLQRYEHSNASSAVVASGSHGQHFHWVAVWKSRASSFKEAYPNAHTAEAFCQLVSEWEGTNPEGYRYLMPFAVELARAIKAHGHRCAFFVITER